MEISGNERLLALWNIMSCETDETHQLDIKELTEKLKSTFQTEKKFDARAIKRDFQTLDESGFEIITNEGKYGKILYSHQSRLFEIYQVRLLADATLSARFIPEEDKQILIQKLKKLTSNHHAKTLPDTLIFNPSSNLNYRLIKLNIDKVHEAISNNYMLEYQYGKYNVDKQFEFHRDGEFYQVEPYALIWQNDFYYLIGKYVPNNEFRHYRLDRIRNVSVTKLKFRRERFDITKYVNQSFHMFAGEEEWIKLEFHSDLMNVMIDRFGLEADIRKLNEERLLLTTKAKVSSGLKSWIMRWGAKVKVISPSDLVKEIASEIGQMQQLY